MTRFEDMIKNELFQAESSEENKNTINILGTLEAAGQEFKYLWLCEMDNKTWPEKPRPNPFLSLGLQKELNMPHSSAQRELDFCNNMTQRFTHHSEHIIFSYAENNRDEKLSPSPLLEKIPRIGKRDLWLELKMKDLSTLSNQIINSQRFETFDDFQNIPLCSKETPKGGQNIIKNQALCPFKAFANHRLDIKCFEDSEISLSSIDRGNIIHELMELFWREVKTQKNLIGLSEKEIFSILEKNKLKINNKYHKQFFERKIAFSLELSRAQEAALLFLNEEKKREYFEVIGFEEKQEKTIKGLKLSLRVDRIDKLEDSSELIIDYKSSNTHTNMWRTPRIDEPQLPIYLINNQKAKGIAFGVLNKNKNEHGLKGIASRHHKGTAIVDCTDNKKNKNFATDWESVLENWENDIEKHALNFMEGVSIVDPKSINTSCTYCEFSTICRINEPAKKYNDHTAFEE